MRRPARSLPKLPSATCPPTCGRSAWTCSTWVSRPYPRVDAFGRMCSSRRGRGTLEDPARTMATSRKRDSRVPCRCLPAMQGVRVNKTKTLKLVQLAGLVLAVGLLPVARAEPPVPAGDSSTSADARFKTIYSTEWAWRTGRAGVSASGESQPDNGRLDDVDAASQQLRLDYWKHVRTQLDGIDVAQLSPANQVN